MRSSRLRVDLVVIPVELWMGAVASTTYLDTFDGLGPTQDQLRSSHTLSMELSRASNPPPQAGDSAHHLRRREQLLHQDARFQGGRLL
jgi:hypothetical protein